MNWTDFSHWGRKIADWTQNYHQTVGDRPVRARTEPGDVLNALPATPPETGEGMEAIFADFETIVMPGITHWQHPRFFAYFTSNAAAPSVLAEFLTSAIAPQCMLWQTSPAATEMETCMMDWLRQALDLPEEFQGVIQDSASSATLAAVLTMREKALNWQGNEQGLFTQKTLRIYCSSEVHTSVDRAIWVAGIGQQNLVRVPIKGDWRGMDPDALAAAIEADIAAGHRPAGVILCVGGTGVGATDPVDQILDVAEKYGLYTHVDAAWAGSAMICPEYRHYWPGIERADSIVFNPHKWLGVQFDCSAHFLKDPDDLVRTLAISPEYLKTHGKDGIINYSEWSVPLGRRFRALKIWFLIRTYGLEGLRQRLRNHVTWSQKLHDRLELEPDFEIVTPPMWSLWSFRYQPDGATDLDDLNLRLVNAINDDGRIYLTQTRVDGALVIRFQAGQFETTEADVMMAHDVITEIARTL
ncbi:pyridoxal phosphate-dependent decarboxylase family protein [Phaeobacter gallaeciensis]|uniref:Aromatic-L-amino-acid decarboxylase n=1 Tax=Phaeobacter gallaeciensis TaxID=60890 RepID=A0AAC9Z622_9RHOB|nr:pyridoxal-dependent decarboxylase [Phaeobacter gallaeciensis]AHD07912.1 Glutamate decarboxylase [Phaeobacter gallaeciensis DSM 26640]ATE91180.1 putative aromatic-L-amino-acid decarboxylase [Phaeobacter gallaeciensis]ATE95455.1 putative aromatic-L-amino-acid decarboxylase [Phaeobacter gallaeciensis]ATE99794.1 putative aromatic-L-amino-acid decarboxylase [Phaeobacter gallaeciensis]ATF04227.1 putative aromatic-L-amino-acid decarboxylase [Phaeobacter gallaeciensis]